ncbi:hypothetical protein GMJLKIPL_5725 [Methylobacterium isbiliense]|uniref:Uncharacterized protein n=1 Tax=Methylobacterium isbiliense TaxID=315478 RepID=A0ABQ4SPP8_9HYPH|nr:hypothetical protein GMJLKIPL_5725 [Methylobacterium isbiliense]
MSAAPSTIRPAESTFEAAITRARRSLGVQAWRAAKEGTMNRPAAAASSAKSVAIRRPCRLDRKAPADRGAAGGAVVAAQ